ncbi:MAG: hypothetical protein ACOYUB_04430 [Patescibacteria group bacterium]
MRKKTTKDISTLVQTFQMFIKNKPKAERMVSEIRMMKFKIRPIQGDMTAVNLKNERFIETLWSLGKLDEFFQSEYPKLSPKNREVFVKIFDDLYHQYQQQLNKINIYKRQANDKNKVLELEIFKDIKNKKIN